MISFIATAQSGNAVRIHLAPPEGACEVRVLRKRADTITAADDPGANVVHKGTDTMFMDRRALVNGTTYFYRAFYLIDSQWVATDSRSVVPKVEFVDVSPDVVELVRERIELGLAAYVERGDLVHPNDAIPVMLAVPADIEGAPYPLVSVHMQTTDVAERGIGDVLTPDYPIGIGEVPDEVVSTEGYLSSHQILVIVWCTNGDVRNAIRRALVAILLANGDVFESEGVVLPKPSFSDVDDMNGYPIPMYQSICSMTCVAPTAVETRAPAIKSVEAILSYPNQG